MPCYSPEIDPAEIEHYEREAELKKEIDKLTDLLCSTLRMIEHSNIGNYSQSDKPELPVEYFSISGLNEWWIEHKKWDEFRRIRDENIKKQKKKEQMIAAALDKLTLEEKEVLGL